MVRGMIVRNRLREQYHSALVIQRNWKRFRAERKYMQIRRAIIAIQSQYRGDCARKRFEELKKNGYPRRQIPKFTIAKVVRKMQLASFNLNEPETLAQFALSEDEDEAVSITSTSESIADEEESALSSAHLDRFYSFYYTS
ncbi:unnamed protein product [Gongylonema pulchrum]|uniref:Spermatogenesis-associated protein 17 n=1 Tax=Gongylonema pulchrum TaxID=637853 RepID=A0A183CYZ5_9BILA|nr:unnamed protein product [Gongylonema pulchrum]